MKKLIVILIPGLLLTACSKQENTPPVPAEVPVAIETVPEKPKDYLKGMKEACEANSIGFTRFEAEGFEVVVYEGGYYHMKAGVNICLEGAEDDCKKMVPQERYEWWGKQFQDPVHRGWYYLDGGFSLRVGRQPYRTNHFHIDAESSAEDRRKLSDEETKVFCTQERNTSISGYKDRQNVGYFFGENFSLWLFYKNGISKYHLTYSIKACLGSPRNCSPSSIDRTLEIGEWKLGAERESNGEVYNQVELDNGDLLYRSRGGNTIKKSGMEFHMYGDFNGAPYLKAEKEEVKNGTKN